MRADGALTVTFAAQDVFDTYAITYQAMPWLEASFRYVVFNPGKKFGSRDELRDRSFEVKARLLEERALLPELALGLRDMIGTGVLASEYLVASKRMGPVDASLGVGWGRLAGRPAFGNPLAQLSDQFRSRSDVDENQQGLLLGSSFFRGRNVGVFGSVAWDLPRWNLTAVAEYNSDDYAREVALGTLPDAAPLSYGLKWRPMPGIETTLSHQHGRDVAFSVSAMLDTRSDTRVKPRRVLRSSRGRRSGSQASDSIEFTRWYDRLLFDVERSDVLLLAAQLTDGGDVVWLEIENNEYQYHADAINRVLELAEVHLPRRIHTVNVVLNTDGLRHGAITYRRRLGSNPFAARAPSHPRAIDVIESRALDAPQYTTDFRKPNGGIDISVGSRLQLMDPDDPLRYQVRLRIGGSADLGADFYLRGAVGLDVYNDFDDIDRPSDSILPRVRSDVARYLREGDNVIDSLYLEHRRTLSNGVLFRGYAGILEQMYSGVGGELLWQPFRSRFAFGLSSNWVRQRDFDQDFGHRDFETVTGFASIYYASPIANFDFAVHAGRYLARDRGATFEARRTFENGWSVGAFATFTNVSADDFGEGSFDKGLFFRIPFDSFLPGNSRGAYTT
ncbi:MAG: YjbH domain-containing protein, partial [Pseudomonadales bacterium]|nr:YjbH domain-containing protein [Pseudomonadales bacterium]